MTETGSTLPRRRMPLGIFLPASLLFLAALLWSFFWLVASSSMRDEMAHWRAEMAAQGTTLACTEEISGGYPFRFETECAKPVIDIETTAGTYKLSAERLRVVAQAYDTQHIIAELAAPIRLNRSDRVSGMLATAEAGSARMSIERANGRLSRLSGVLPHWRAVIGLPDAPETMIESSGGEIHLRPRSENDSLDLAVFTGRSSLTDESVAGRAEVDRISLVAVVDKPPPLTPATADTWFARWRDAGGVADVRQIAFDSATLAGEGAGAVNLTPEGKLEGALNMRFAKLDHFVGELESRSVISGDDAGLLMGAVGLFAQTVNGEKAVTLPVRLRDGEVYMGPVKIVALPALE